MGFRDVVYYKVKDGENDISSVLSCFKLFYPVLICLLLLCTGMEYYSLLEYIC
jgi:hypothetical protein